MVFQEKVFNNKTINKEITELLNQRYINKQVNIPFKQLGLTRAIKIISKVSIESKDETKLFEEVNILKNLDHPNIVKLYELF